MTKYTRKAVAILGSLLLLMSTAFAQYQSGGGFGSLAQTKPELVAHDYGQYQYQLSSAVGAVSASVVVVPFGTANISAQNGSCFKQMANGRFIIPLAVGVPIKVSDGAASETVTLTGLTTTNGICTATATFGSAHSAGVVISSGDDGLVEAIQDAASNAFNGTVVLDPSWSGTTAQITGMAVGAYASNVSIRDKRTGYDVYWAVRPTGSTPLAAGAAPVDAAATGGAMVAGTHRLMYEYVDVNGQSGTQSAELADGNSRTGLLVTAPAASTGAVGWIPFVTANGGATKTEIMVPVTASVCTLTTLETVIPACAIGASATILADPSGTAKIFGNASLTAANDTGFNTSSTTAGYIQVAPQTANLPFQPVYNTLATAAASNSTYEVAAFNLPAGFFNVLKKKWNFCGSYHATSAANSETLTINLRYGPYQNSDTVLIPLVTSAYSSTNVIDGKFCVDITDAATGATGTLNVHGQLITNLAGTAVETWFTEATAGNAATGVIASLPLSTQQQFTVEAVIGAGAFGSAITFDSLGFEPVN